MKMPGTRNPGLHVSLVSVLLLLFPAMSWSAPGALDSSFGTGGIVITDLPPASTSDWAEAIALQPDGKILVAGTNNTNKFAIARYTSSGSLDSGFGTNGSTITDIPVSGMVHDMVLQADGKILVCGVGNNGEFTVVRYLADGNLDTGFDGDGIVNVPFTDGPSIAFAIALQADGKIVLAGEVAVAAAGSERRYAIARLDSAGNLDSSFDGDGRVTTDVGAGGDIAYAVAVQADGKIVGAGSTGSDVSLVRYNPDGSLDIGFGTDGRTVVDPGTLDDYIYALAIQPDGKLVVAGSAIEGVADRGFLLLRVDVDGSLDAGFGTSGRVIQPVANIAWEQANALVVQPDGKLVVTGEYQFPQNDWDIAVIRFDSDGTLDTTFATTGIVTHDFGTVLDFGNAVALQPDGRILVAGQTDGDFFVMRFEGSSLDVTPGAVSFTDEIDVSPSQLQTSDMVTVGGLGTGVSVPVSVVGGEYALNGAATYTSGINWVTNGDQVNVRHTSAAAEGTTVSTTLRLGGVMAPNGIVHLGTAETVVDSYDSTTATTGSSGGGSSSSSIDWLLLAGLGLLALLRCGRRSRRPAGDE